MIPAARLAPLAVLVPLLAGCMGPPEPRSLDITLIRQDANGREDGRFILTAYNSGEDDVVELATQDESERFTGRLIQERTVSQEWLPSLYQRPIYRRGRLYYSSDDTYVLRPVSRYSSNAVALMSGDKGRTLKCSFHMDIPIQGIFGGGSGDCVRSDGTKYVVPSLR
jgi:hypothetical protein